MGVENGWGYWQSFPGTFGPLSNPVLTFSALGNTPATPRFTITSGSNIDRYSPGAPGTPTLPVVAPGFGQHSILLGQAETDGIGGNCSQSTQGNPGPGCAERLKFCFTVGPNDTNFIYAYAFVIEDPGHGPGEEPFISFTMLDATGDTVSCAYQRYEADQADPRQYLAGRTRTNSQGTITQATYKPWTIAGVNLTNYIGQTLTVVITNADCARGGHFAHSYWDFKCGNADAIVVPNCIYNSADTLTGPPSTDPVSDPYSYTWFKNNTPNPVGNTQTIYPLSQNGDTFTVRVSNLAGCSWYARFVPQHDSVKADFLPQTHCGYATFINQSFSPFVNDTIFSWTWTFSGGTPATGTGQFPGNIYFPPGDHLVTLISGSRTPGCMDTVQRMVNVPHDPVADFSAPALCAKSDLTFTNLSSCELDDTLSAYSWSFPGASPSVSTDSIPTILYTAGGSYPVTLVATTLDGCSDTVQKNVQVLQRPAAAFNAFTVCEGYPLPLNNTTVLAGPYQPMTYDWSVQNATPSVSTDSSLMVTFNSAGPALITLIATTPEGCSDTTQALLNVNITPDASFTADPICEGDTLRPVNLTTIDSGATVTGYQWFFTGGDVDTSSAFEPAVSYALPGSFPVTMIATSSAGCVDTASLTAEVNARPVAYFVLSDACHGEPVTINDSSFVPGSNAALSYSWSAPDGQFSSTSVPEPDIQFADPGVHPVTLLVTSATGCADTLQQIANVNSLPGAAFSFPPVCLGQPATIVNQTSDNGNSQIAYQWFVSGGSIDFPNAIEPVLIFSDTGQHSVELIAVTGSGCSDTLSQSVTVYRPPIAAVSNGDSACVPVCHAFSDLSQEGDGSINQWQWSFPGGEPASFSGRVPPEICYNVPGSYDVLLEVVSSTGCSSTRLVDRAINGYSVPTAGFNVTGEYSGTSSPVFNFADSSSSDVVLWSWDFGDGSLLTSSSPDQTHSYSSAVPDNDFYRFLITLAVTTRYGCVDTVYKTIDIRPEFTFYAPNAFTPNGDGENQEFFAKGVGIVRYAIRIFDRWGLQLWNCEQEGDNVPWDAFGNDGMPGSCRWDGTYQGSPVEADVYVWQVELTDVFGSEHLYNGKVTVTY
ncbi:MAG: hypothetical protein RL213_222 [Bacteroidota bacterium]